MKSFRKLTLEITLPVSLSALAGGIVAALAGAWAVPVLAQQQAAPPIFSWDHTIGWIGMGEFRPVPGKVPPVTNDPKYPYVPNNQGRQPTYRIADLTNPNLKPWVKEVMKKDNDEVLGGKIAYTPGSSCRPAGVTAFVLDGGPYFFVQTPTKVLIIQQGEQIARQIYLNVPHSANPKPTWFGESVGHYEGDTLVVDTIGMNARTFVDQFRTPHTDKLHVVERWRMIEEGKRLEVLITIEDPDTFNQPWKAMVRWDRTQATLPENICVEGNLLLFDWGVPQTNTPDF